MNGKQPNRLRKEQFLHSSSPLKLYRQEVGGRHELHWHEFYELCFITSGKGWNIVNGQKHPLTPGSLFLLTPADFHEIYADGSDSMRLFNLVFDEEMLSDELRGLLFADGRLLMADFAPTPAIRIQAEFERIEEETTDRRLGGSLMIRGAMERILLELARQSGVETEAGASPPPAFSPIQKALVYMHHHFRDPLPLETAARQARLSPNYFSECFRKHTGMPFQAYLQHLRLTFAVSLLSASRLPITEVCHISGFQTLTHFERVFKSRYGVSPRRYQKRRTLPDGG